MHYRHFFNFLRIAMPVGSVLGRTECDMNRSLLVAAASFMLHCEPM
jgi:hypothetical protein